MEMEYILTERVYVSHRADKKRNQDLQYIFFPKKTTTQHGKKELQITNALQKHKTEAFIMKRPEG